MKTRTLAILLFPNAEVLDFAGPFEVFSVAGEVAGETIFDVKLVSATPGIIHAANGFPIQVTQNIADLPQPDILLVPGGAGARALVDEASTIAWIHATAAEAELTLSVCTGAFPMAKAGVLDGIPCTTHWEFIERLREAYPHLDVRDNVRFIDAGNVVSSAGITAGIDMSLYVVGRLHGVDLAKRTARAMEYTWEP